MKENGRGKKDQMSFEEKKRLFVEIALLAESYQDDDESEDESACQYTRISKMRAEGSPQVSVTVTRRAESVAASNV